MRVKDSTKNLNCFKATWRYFGDKGIYLVLINLLPTLLLPFVLSPSVTMYYLFDMKTIDTSSISALFSYMWSMSYSFWYIGIIGAVLLVFSAAITFGVIDRHMRVGEFTISPNRVKSRLNYNILTAIKFVIVAIASLEFFNIVATLLYYLWANVFADYAAKMVFSCCTLIIMELSMIFTMSWFILWPPFMLHTGMKTSAAFKTAWGSMSGRLIRTVFAIFVVVVPLQIVMIITAACNLGDICRTVLDAISYAIIVPYYITLMYNTFYDITGTERMDIEAKKKDIWAKK